MPTTIARNGQIRSNNTTISHRIENGERIIRCTLHQTVIATYHLASGTVHLFTGGWNTPTTIRRMNECLHAWGFKARVCKADFKDAPDVRISSADATV